MEGVRESLDGLRFGGIEAADHVNANRLRPIAGEAGEDDDFLILVGQLPRKPPGVISDSVELRGKGSRQNGNSHCGQIMIWSGA